MDDLIDKEIAYEHDLEVFTACKDHVDASVDWTCRSCGSGNVELITRARVKEDAAARADRYHTSLINAGYRLSTESWKPGAWSGGDFFMALLACLVLVGILIFIYMAIIKPQGILTRVYLKRGRNDPEDAVELASSVGDEAMKICPDCAEEIKAAALLCRYCRHDFTEAERPS